MNDKQGQEDNDQDDNDGGSASEEDDEESGLSAAEMGAAQFHAAEAALEKQKQKKLSLDLSKKSQEMLVEDVRRQLSDFQNCSQVGMAFGNYKDEDGVDIEMVEEPSEDESGDENDLVAVSSEVSSRMDDEAIARALVQTVVQAALAEVAADVDDVNGAGRSASLSSQALAREDREAEDSVKSSLIQMLKPFLERVWVSPLSELGLRWRPAKPEEKAAAGILVTSGNGAAELKAALERLLGGDSRNAEEALVLPRSEFDSFGEVNGLDVGCFIKLNDQKHGDEKYFVEASKRPSDCALTSIQRGPAIDDWSILTSVLDLLSIPDLQVLLSLSDRFARKSACKQASVKDLEEQVDRLRHKAGFGVDQGYGLSERNSMSSAVDSPDHDVAADAIPNESMTAVLEGQGEKWLKTVCTKVSAAMRSCWGKFTDCRKALCKGVWPMRALSWLAMRVRQYWLFKLTRRSWTRLRKYLRTSIARSFPQTLKIKETIHPDAETVNGVPGVCIELPRNRSQHFSWETRFIVRALACCASIVPRIVRSSHVLKMLPRKPEQAARRKALRGKVRAKECLQNCKP